MPASTPEFFPGRNSRNGVVGALRKAASTHRLWMGAAGVVGGTACALYSGNLSVWPAMLCLTAILPAQMGVNLLRSYIGLKGAVAPANSEAVSAEGVPVSILLKQFAIGCFLITSLSLLGLAGMSGFWALIPSLLIGILVYFYIGIPTPLLGSWWEQLCQFLFFGPVAVFCTFFFQALHSWGAYDKAMADAGPAVLSSLVIGLLAVNASLVGNCCDDENNPQVNRHNFAARFGVKGVSLAILASGVVFFVIQCVICLNYPMQRWGLVVMIPTLSFILNCVVGISIRKGTRRRLEKMYKLAIWNPFIYSLLALAVLIALREPSHGGFVIFG